MKKQKSQFNVFENYSIHNALSFMMYEKNLALIIPCKTGIFWEHQIAGTGCLHKNMEGVLVPFREKNRGFFEGEKRRLLMVDHLYNYFIDRKDLGGYNIDEESIEFMNCLFNQYNLPFEVDIKKQEESYEAWVWVKICPQENWEELASWFEKSVVLIWDNTD